MIFFEIFVCRASILVHFLTKLKVEPKRLFPITINYITVPTK